MLPRHLAQYEAYLNADKKDGIDVLSEAFGKQKDFIENTARRKALWCTRRAAKSYTAGLYLVETALAFSAVNCLYLGLTRFSAKGIIWKDILKTIDRKYDLGMQFNGSELTATTKNGSVIHTLGIDADADEMHKLLGKKWKLVVIDEAQSFSQDLRSLIYGILGPALADQRGTVCMMGTAGNMTQGLFYDVTNRKEEGWELFQWTAHDNPYMATQWQAELDEIRTERPLFMETSLYKQWYLNQWVIDEEARVYKFEAAVNTASQLPYDLSDFHYVLGLDLAHSPDSTAFVVGCYHDASPTLFVVYSFKATEMDLTDVAVKIRELERRYKLEIKVADGANKQAVAELNNRHSLGLIAADKTAKTDFIAIMNDDFIQRRIMLLPGTEELQDEYHRLVWVTDANGKVKEPRKENPAINQDLCDSTLYLWRYCYQYLFAPSGPPLDKSAQSYWEPKHIEKLVEQVKKAKNPNELDLQWEETWDHQDEDLL